MIFCRGEVKFSHRQRMRLEDVVQFITGTSLVPLTPENRFIKVEFSLGREDQETFLRYFITCANTVRLAVCDSPEVLRKVWIKLLENSGAVGFALC